MAKYTMIIVDDEPITRQGIRCCIDWESIDIEIVGEADNGLEAMLLIHDLNPNIVICDIRMPKLDGISLINEVHTSHPDLQVLFLSGYSDREYLKNAIRLEAVDYIFKPFLLPELLAGIEKAKRNCDKAARKASPPVSSDIALTVLQPDDNNTIDWETLPINRNSEAISILIRLNAKMVQMSNNSDDGLFDPSLAAGKYYGHFRHIADEIFSGKFIMSRAGAGYVVHVNISDNFLNESRVLLNKLCILPESTKQSGLVSVGVGNPCASCDFLHESYSQARDALHNSFLLGSGKVIYYHDRGTEPFEPKSDLNERFYDCLSDNKITSALDYLDNYISYMSRCRIQDIPIIKDVLTSIAFWINERMKEFQSSESYVADKIHYAVDLFEIKSYLKMQIDGYTNGIANLDDKGKILLEVERYIIKNYDRDLSIKNIASQVYITPNYLCYLYKKKTGRTLNRFILDVKMDKARRMICETPMRFGEISDALGYASQNYFTRIFTQYFGMSPRSYRNSNGTAGSDDENTNG